MQRDFIADMVTLSVRSGFELVKFFFLLTVATAISAMLITVAGGTGIRRRGFVVAQDWRGSGA